MIFINTRPASRADDLTKALNDAGYQVESLPLLELVPQPFSNELQQLYQQLSETQIIVVVSPTAVEIGIRYLQRAGLPLQQLKHIQWIAVGNATAQALAKFNIESHVPEVESSEGMLELPILQQQDHLKKIAFWRGLGGRQFMMQQLQQQGVSLLNFVLYRLFLIQRPTNVVVYHDLSKFPLDYFYCDSAAQPLCVWFFYAFVRQMPILHLR
jgi:uroporphyrinogen-III synthase